MNLALAIDDTKKAASRCRAAHTTLQDLPITPQRRAWLVALESVIAELETELARLRYAARHPKAAVQ